MRGRLPGLHRVAADRRLGLNTRNMMGTHSTAWIYSRICTVFLKIYHRITKVFRFTLYVIFASQCRLSKPTPLPDDVAETGTAANGTALRDGNAGAGGALAATTSISRRA